MTDYISRETLKKRFCGHCEEYGKCQELCFDMELINNTPAANVVEQKTGNWIEREDMYYGWNIWECSNCHEEFCIEEGSPKDNEYYYCPNCGADMREETE